MNEADVGRILPASLHQGIADLLPSRLEFYEEWLNPKAMRDGRIGVAPLAAVFSFLRRENACYDPVTIRAGEYAAEWVFAGSAGLTRFGLRMAPAWARRRLAGRLMRQLTSETCRDSKATIRWQGSTGTLVLTGSLFCTVRERIDEPLCGYYAAAMRRLTELAGIPLDVTLEQCRAAGRTECRMRLAERSA